MPEVKVKELLAAGLLVSGVAPIFEQVSRAVKQLLLWGPRQIDTRTIGSWLYRDGGYFCLLSKTSGKPLFIALIGKVHEEKADKYLKLAQEKAIRLHDLHGRKKHLSSWQSREPENKRYGGAIIGDHYIWSFSGLPEEGDEAAMLVAAQNAGDINLKTRNVIARLSRNPIPLDMLLSSLYH